LNYNVKKYTNGYVGLTDHCHISTNFVVSPYNEKCTLCIVRTHTHTHIHTHTHTHTHTRARARAQQRGFGVKKYYGREL